MLATQLLTAADPAFYGVTANGASDIPSINDSGEIVAFRSLGVNLLPDEEVPGQIYALDRTSDEMVLVTANPGGLAPSRVGGRNPVVSPDGRFVLFVSPAKNLVEEDLGGDLNLDLLFLRDLATNTTTLSSVAPDGQAGDGDSRGDSNFSVGGIRPSVYAFNGNGRYVVFWSEATNLVSPAPAGADQLYVRDLQSRVTTVVSVDSNGDPATSSPGFQDVPFCSVSISHDGRYASFITDINSLTPGDANGVAFGRRRSAYRWRRFDREHQRVFHPPRGNETRVPESGRRRAG